MKGRHFSLIKPLLSLLLAFSIVFLLNTDQLFASLSCSITTQAGCFGTVVLGMSSSSNAHAAMPGSITSPYDTNVVCCTGPVGLATTCSGTFDTVLKLASTTNSHVQENTQSGYANLACLSIPTGVLTIAYRNTDCTGYDTTMLSLSASDNAHVGSPSTYTRKVCGTAVSTGPQYLSSTLSSNAVGFGSLLQAVTIYGSANLQGTTTLSSAQTLTVVSNAQNGYTVTVSGKTLTSTSNGSSTVREIGGTGQTAQVGTSQFGIRLQSSGGDGTTTTAYTSPLFAYNGTSSPSQVAYSSQGTNATSTFSLTYMTNIASTTSGGSYTTDLTYSVTANF